MAAGHAWLFSMSMIVQSTVHSTLLLFQNPFLMHCYTSERLLHKSKSRKSHNMIRRGGRPSNANTALEATLPLCMPCKGHTAKQGPCPKNTRGTSR